MTSLFNHPLGFGPALTACADILPLYRDPQGNETNILPELPPLLAKAYDLKVTPEEFVAYLYGMLAQPAFTKQYGKELGTRELRVPVTKDRTLFLQVRDTGAKLLWLHTYGQRFVPKGRHPEQLPKGKARCTKPVPGDAANYPERYEYNHLTETLRVGDGEFAPVVPDVYEFEVSGLKVVQSWLKYRMKIGGGKKSSPLDDIRPERWTGDFTTELLELLWVLEATLEQYPTQARLLSAVVRGPCFRADELPPVPDHARKPSREGSLLDQLEPE
jgi:hypothetical protein